MPGLDPNSPSQVADAIARMCDALEEATDTYRADIERAARSGAAYRLAWAEAMLAEIGNTSGSSRRITVAEREARVEVATNDDRIVAEVHEAQAKATKELLNSLRVRLDSARSLGANLRALT